MSKLYIVMKNVLYSEGDVSLRPVAAHSTDLKPYWVFSYRHAEICAPSLPIHMFNKCLFTQTTELKSNGPEMNFLTFQIFQEYYFL